MNKIIPFKGRVINVENVIHVYRNLNRTGKVYSIRQNGIVVGHITGICMKHCIFVVSDSGKERAVKSGVRNVHAYVSGYLSDNLGNGNVLKINYMPFNIMFYWK